jgi:hypothetical protein
MNVIQVEPGVQAGISVAKKCVALSPLPEKLGSGEIPKNESAAVRSHRCTLVFGYFCYVY